MINIGNGNYRVKELYHPKHLNKFKDENVLNIIFLIYHPFSHSKLKGR